MIRQALALTLALGLAHEPSCGGTDAGSGGANAPCTRKRDCKESLECVRGVCEPPDAAPPGDAGDARGDG